MIQSAASEPQQEAPCFNLKGGMVPMTVLELHFFDSNAFEQALQDKIRQAPGFFKDLPILIGLEHYQGPAAELDFFKLIGICRQHNIHVVAVRGGDDDLRRLARNAALAWLPPDTGRPSRPKTERTEESQEAEAPQPEAEPVAETQAAQPETGTPGKIVTQPVRSGQQVYAPDGDLIILAPVSAGAEVLAAGNIHVYGPLRGRALAGIYGDSRARIFCQSLEAELVSVAGQYKISEDLQENCWKQTVQVQLKDDVLVVSPLV
ncbi:septum site-determining protein MinC [Marinobacteraceae bacterium S3BR75-40.1]